MITLVDGSNTILRLASVAKKSGESGDFIRRLLEFIYWNGMECEQMIFFWEGQNSTKTKKDIYPAYKEGRIKQEDDRYVQTCFELAKEILSGLHICCIQVENCEADDVIAHYALHSDKPIKIISEDRDYIQLLTKSNIVLNRPTKRITLKGIDVLESEGIIVENFILAKALCGDKSDNIKGLTSVDIPRLVHYFPELCLKEMNEDQFLEQISKLEYINENKFSEKRDYVFRCSLIEKIINNFEDLKLNLKIMKMGDLPELEKNKMQYQLDKYNDKEKKVDRKVLMQLMTMNNISFNMTKFQGLFLTLCKFTKNKV